MFFVEFAEALKGFAVVGRKHQRGEIRALREPGEGFQEAAPLLDQAVLRHGIAAEASKKR